MKNKVTVHLEMSDTHWMHVVRKAEQLGMTVEQYIAGAALNGIDDSLYDEEVYG